MACRLVSVNFSPPSTLPMAVHCRRESYPKAPAHCRTSSLWFTRAFEITSFTFSIKCTARARQDSSKCHIGVPSRDLFGLAFSLSDVNNRSRVLTGYWVGPDTEDGWGFVEAFICEIL